MVRAIARAFAKSPALPRIEDEARAASLFTRWRWSVFLSIVIGYTVFYVTRLGTSVAKDPMIEGGALSIQQLGTIDSVFHPDCWTYDEVEYHLGLVEIKGGAAKGTI